MKKNEDKTQGEAESAERLSCCTQHGNPQDLATLGPDPPMGSSHMRQNISFSGIEFLWVLSPLSEAS